MQAWWHRGGVNAIVPSLLDRDQGIWGPGGLVLVVAHRCEASGLSSSLPPGLGMAPGDSGTKLEGRGNGLFAGDSARGAGWHMQGVLVGGDSGGRRRSTS